MSFYDSEPLIKIKTIRTVGKCATFNWLMLSVLYLHEVRDIFLRNHLICVHPPYLNRPLQISVFSNALLLIISHFFATEVI